MKCITIVLFLIYSFATQAQDLFPGKFAQRIFKYVKEKNSNALNNLYISQKEYIIEDSSYFNEIGHTHEWMLNEFQESYKRILSTDSIDWNKAVIIEIEYKTFLKNYVKHADIIIYFSIDTNNYRLKLPRCLATKNGWRLTKAIGFKLETEKIFLEQNERIALELFSKKLIRSLSENDTAAFRSCILSETDFYKLCALKPDHDSSMDLKKEYSALIKLLTSQFEGLRYKTKNDSINFKKIQDLRFTYDLSLHNTIKSSDTFIQFQHNGLTQSIEIDDLLWYNNNWYLVSRFYWRPIKP